RMQQRFCVLAAQPAQLELIQASRIEAALLPSPSRDHDRDRLGLQPARAKRDRLLRWLVEPVRVVDEAQKRLLLARLREQTERGERDQKRALYGIEAQPERTPQCRGLRGREELDSVKARSQELMEPCERQLVFGFDPDASQNRHTAGTARGM